MLQSPILSISSLTMVAALTLAIALAVPTTIAASGTPDDVSSVTESPDEDTSTQEPPGPAITGEQQRELANLSRQLRRETQNWIRRGDTDKTLDPDDALRRIARPHTPAKIFAWIENNIAFEPYTGALRGATGALIAGSANAVDQALLAKQLLENAGHEVRLVSGQLHRSDAADVLGELLGPSLVLTRPGSGGEAVNTASTADHSATLKAVQDHLWVEVGTGDDARPFDPVAAPTYGMTPATAEDRHDALPDRHRTHFEMTLSSDLDDGQSIEHLVVDGPLTRVAFAALTLSFEDDPTRPRGHRPILRFGDDELRGKTIPVSALERLELQFRFTSPGHQNRWSQVLFRQGTGVDIFDVDHQHFAIAVVPGWTPDAKLRQEAGNAAEAAIDTIDHWLQSEASEIVDDAARREHMTTLIDHLGAALPFAFARTLDRTSDNASEKLGVLPVLGRPRVLTTGLLRDGEAFHVDLQVDGDRIEALPRLGIPAVATTAFVGLHGLIRDHLISEMLESYGDHEVTTVRRIIRAATRQSIPFTTVGSHNFDRLQQLSIDDDTRQMIAHQIRQRNMSVLAPLRPVDDGGVERIGWWAANPIDGNLEGHTTDAIVAVGDQEEDGDVAIEDLIRIHLELVARHYSAASHATATDPRFPELACSSARQFNQISRGFCATTAAIPEADLASCLANPPRPERSLLNPADTDCTSQFASFRCAASYSSALLDGSLLVMPADADAASQSSAPRPLCD